jgi:hypothetical protein
MANVLWSFGNEAATIALRPLALQKFAARVTAPLLAANAGRHNRRPMQPFTRQFAIARPASAAARALVLVVVRVVARARRTG